MGMVVAAIASGAAGCQTRSAKSAAPPSAASGGNLPTGVWRLNRARSEQLTPTDQTLWIVKDDGKHLIWVLVITEPDGTVRLNTWDGPYDAEPRPVGGTPMLAQISSKAAGTLQSRGVIEGLGTFSEDCAVSPDRRRFTCRGEVTGADGAVRRWIDDFDWVSGGPP